MREWAARDLAKSRSSGFTVFYPFSGPDFVNPYTLFPGAGTYILIALEPIGEIPDFQAMSRTDFDSFFADMRKSLHDSLRIDYFISSHMHTSMESKELNGSWSLTERFKKPTALRVASSARQAPFQE
jgi:hypothetical protein